MVSFNNPVIQYLVIPSGATSGARIVIDGVNGVILVYDTNNQLIASVTPGQGTDPTGQTWVAGFTSYESGARSNYAQIFNGELVLNTALDTVAGGALVIDNNGPNLDQPEMQVFSPAYSGFPQPNAAYLQLFGANATNTESPYARIGARGGPASDMDVLISGQLKYSPPSSLGAGAETWHAILPQTNWSALGAPWADPQYRRDANGYVEFVGAIQWTNGVTAAPVTIFTLPAGYIPNKSHRLCDIVMPGNATTPQVEGITVMGASDTSPGAVLLTNYPAGGPNTPITLTGLRFPLVS